LRAVLLAALLTTLPGAALAQSVESPPVLLVGGTYGSPSGPTARVVKVILSHRQISPSFGGAIGPGGYEFNVGGTGWTMPTGKPREGAGVHLNLVVARTFSRPTINFGTPNSTYIGFDYGSSFHVFYASAGYVRRLGGNDVTGRNRFACSIGVMIPLVR
jgi:hypothetical protein